MTFRRISLCITFLCCVSAKCVRVKKKTLTLIRHAETVELDKKLNAVGVAGRGRHNERRLPRVTVSILEVRLLGVCMCTHRVCVCVCVCV